MENSVPQKTISFSIAWWNTSLSPSARTRANAKLEEKQAAFAIIELMIRSSIDFIALGEVSEDDVNFFESHLLEFDYELRSGLQSAGRSKFDTCFIYKKDKFNFAGPTRIIRGRGNQNLRVAQRIDIELLEFESIFHLFVSHWSSRLWTSENSPQRHLLGTRLRDSVDEILNLYKQAPHIILLGDYNDEPFDVPLSENLMASRDRALVARKKHLLYNPFWKNMTDMNESGDESQYICGTYFHKDGNITKWRTFDQIMFSHAFVNSQSWCLNERSTGVLLISQYLEIVKSTKEIFDHMPVLGVVEKVV